MAVVPMQGKESTSMNIIRIKTIAALTIAVTGALGVGMAQANPNVRWSVSIAVPLQVYGQPVYVQPQPVYYGRPAAYRYPTRWDRDADGIPDRYERNHGRHGDRDRDGVPDRYDRRPGDPWRH